MKRKLFMKRSQSRAGSGFARVMTMLTLTLTMLCVQSANAFTLTCLRGNGFGEGEGCQKLFDGTQDTKWGTSDGWYGKPVYAVAKATMPIAPTTYSLKIANDTYQSPGRNWKSWRIFGGNFASDEEAVNGAEGWVLLDEKVDQQMTTDKFAEVQFDLSNPDVKFYSYFKIEVEALAGGWGEYCQMDEFWFRDFTIDLSEAQVYLDFNYKTADADANIKAEYELKRQDLEDAITKNDPDLIAPAIEAIEPIYKKINKIFSVTLKNGTADADKWTIDPVDAKEGDEIKATYTGKLKVKSVKAVKKEVAEPADNAYLMWDAAQKKLVATKIPAEVTTVENANQNVEWSAGTYVVEGEVTINGKIYLTGNVNLIIKDGAKLTATRINSPSNDKKTLSIYGQSKMNGELVINSTSSYAYAIDYLSTLSVHSAKVTANSTSPSSGGIFAVNTINVYGGLLDAKYTGSDGYGIYLSGGGKMNIYGGEVKAASNGTGANSYGIMASTYDSAITVTVYGGKLWAESPGNTVFNTKKTTFAKGGDFNGKIETSSDGSSWTEYTEAGTPGTKYVRVGY